MKKLLIFTLSILLNSYAFAQNSATFKVDLSDYTGSYSMVNLNGTFNNWCGECAVMTDDNSDNIYEITVTDLADGPYEFKFTLDGWTTAEEFTPGAPCTLTTGTFTNRIVTLTGDTIMPAVCWENCVACGGAPISADVTFRVDMSEYTGPAFSMVNLNGTFNNWCGNCAPMTDDDGDDIYEITTNLLVGVNEYKFTLDGWEGEEILTEGSECTLTTDGFTNRTLDVTEETVLPAVCWESCMECAVGIEDISFESNFTISPNPSRDIFNVNISEEITTPVLLTVFNMIGEQVGNINNAFIGMNTIDLTNEPVGVYFIKFDDGVNSTYKRIARIK